MIASAKTLPSAGCLFLLLCVAGCDHAWSTLVGPNELGAATPTMHDEVDDGIEDPILPDDVEPGVEDGCPKVRILVCCSCNGNSCTKPDNCPDPV
jgi:hypothetical protein